MDTENDEPLKSLGKVFLSNMSILEYFCWKFRLVISGYPGSAVETALSFPGVAWGVVSKFKPVGSPNKAHTNHSHKIFVYQVILTSLSPGGHIYHLWVWVTKTSKKQSKRHRQVGVEVLLAILHSHRPGIVDVVDIQTSRHDLGYTPSFRCRFFWFEHRIWLWHLNRLKRRAPRLCHIYRLWCFGK